MTKNVKLGLLGAGALALYLAWKSRKVASSPSASVSGEGVRGLTDGRRPPVDEPGDCRCKDPTDTNIEFVCDCAETMPIGAFGALTAMDEYPYQKNHGVEDYAVRSGG